MKRYILAIEGHGFEDVEEIELPGPPVEGEPIETKYGTGIVSSTEELDDAPQFDGKISCRLP
jgi:hypothetical protein